MNTIDTRLQLDPAAIKFLTELDPTLALQIVKDLRRYTNTVYDLMAESFGGGMFTDLLTGRYGAVLVTYMRSGPLTSIMVLGWVGPHGTPPNGGAFGGVCINDVEIMIARAMEPAPVRTPRGPQQLRLWYATSADALIAHGPDGAARFLLFANLRMSDDSKRQLSERQLRRQLGLLNSHYGRHERMLGGSAMRDALDRANYKRFRHTETVY